MSPIASCTRQSHYIRLPSIKRVRDSEDLSKGSSNLTTPKTEALFENKLSLDSQTRVWLILSPIKSRMLPLLNARKKLQIIYGDSRSYGINSSLKLRFSTSSIVKRRRFPNLTRRFFHFQISTFDGNFKGRVCGFSHIFEDQEIYGNSQSRNPTFAYTRSPTHY